MPVLRGTYNSEINVTPFLDVLLVLLVIFMTVVQSQKVLYTNTAEESRQDCASACESIVLEVLPRGEFALNTSRFHGSELRSRLLAAFTGRPASVLFVKGDVGVTYQDVVSAMDEAKGAGVQVIAIAPKTVR